ncbi:2-oxoacid:acceptor oxidoreductase family protein [Candidatus Amarolinea aalborgensis]|jgi:2-oxoglutarate ferredoxin oxidoreductase subunit gamma|uniref:2-oxoacid:acceptor oxidoreductase family protein n=1 Tax=Candidatus Amarolinea aalborgensis TaxID=2249329 RepID=UPI003BF9D35C
MEFSIIFSGFGGQGALFAGQLMAYASMDEGKAVTWIPSYGPEMRGGTAHCIVVVGDEEVGAPLVRTPDAVIALNLPSVDKYESLVKPGGFLIYNSSLVPRAVTRADIHVIPVPGNEIATALGNVKLTNVIMLGALLQATNLLPLEALDRALLAHLPERNRRFLEPNKVALRRGAEYAMPLHA